LGFLFALTSFGFTARTQECTFYFPVSEGATFEITNYNPKGKPIGRAEHEVLEKSMSGSNTAIKVASKIFDKKDEELTNLEYEVLCEDGVFKFNMYGINMEQIASADINAKLEGDYLDIPANPTPGQDLGDGEMTLTINEMMKMTTKVLKRKVEKVEEITTDAGTFECFKITYDYETKFMIGIKGSTATWYAKEVGMVKSENFSKNGKSQGYSLLTKFKN